MEAKRIFIANLAWAKQRQGQGATMTRLALTHLLNAEGFRTENGERFDPTSPRGVYRLIHLTAAYFKSIDDMATHDAIAHTFTDENGEFVYLRRAA